MYAGIPGVADFPSERFEEMVAPNLDIRWHEICNFRISPAEHRVFSRRLKMVIDNLDGARTVGNEDGLRIEADAMNVKGIGIDHGAANSIKDNSSPDIASGGAVDVATVEDYVGRQLRQGSS